MIEKPLPATSNTEIGLQRESIHHGCMVDDVSDIDGEQWAESDLIFKTRLRVGDSICCKTASSYAIDSKCFSNSDLLCEIILETPLRIGAPAADLVLSSIDAVGTVSMVVTVPDGPPPSPGCPMRRGTSAGPRRSQIQVGRGESRSKGLALRRRTREGLSSAWTATGCVQNTMIPGIFNNGLNGCSVRIHSPYRRPYPGKSV